MIAGLGAAGILAAGAGAGVVAFGGAMTVGVGVAAATPEEDCAAVRARDHQIWLDMVATLPPGAPIPPEYVNPCIAEDPSYAPGADGPGGAGGQTGQMGGGAGISPGTNAPTNLAPATPGGDIVPLPGQSLAPQPGASTQDLVPGARVPDESGTEASPGQEREDRGDRDGQGRILAPAEVGTDGTRVVTTDPDAVFVQETDPASGDAGKMLLLLTGVAGGLAGASRFGRGSLAGGRWTWRTPAPAAVRPWESSLSQAVGTVAGPLVVYAPGGQSKITIDEPGGGQRTLFLIHDETSSHEAVIPVDVPEGGSMRVNDDGTVTVLDADGAAVYVVDAPWAYDADGNAVDTDFVVRDGQLYQRVFADAETAYPILADPPGDEVEENPLKSMPFQNLAEKSRQSSASGGDVDAGAAAMVAATNKGAEKAESNVGIIDTTGRKDGETWKEPRPNGEVITHTMVEGSGGQSVDSRATRTDGTFTDIRTANDGDGGWKAWSDNSDGTASYADNDVSNDRLETFRFNESPVHGQDAVVTSQANSANTSGVVQSSNLDGSQSVGEFERVSDNRVDMTVDNPDGNATEVVSTLNEHGRPSTLVQDSDGIRVFDADGNMVELTEDLLQETSNVNQTVQYDPNTGKWVPYYFEPEGASPADGHYWNPYEGEWVALSQEIIQQGVKEGHLEVGDDGRLYMTDGWSTFLAGAIFSGGTDAVIKPLESAARASGDLRIAGLAANVGRRFGYLGYIPGIWLDNKDGRSNVHIAGKTMTGIVAGGATTWGLTSLVTGTGFLAGAAATAPVWAAPVAVGTLAIVAAGTATWIFGKIWK